MRGPYEKVKAYSSLYRYNSFLLPILANNIVNRQDNSDAGYLPLKGGMQGPAQQGTPAMFLKSLDSTKLQYFQEFVQATTNAGSRVMVLVSPCYRKMDQLPYSIAASEEICRKLSVPFADYSQAPEFISSPNLFHDAYHLNDEGARKFTAILLKQHLGKL